MKDWERALLNAARRLDEGQRETLTAFAEFLAGRAEAAAEPTELSKPLDIPRPEQESVVKAIKRLSATYPMLDKAKMLNDTSTLMAEHTLQGRDADEVITELEVVFERHYTHYVSRRTGDDGN